MWCPQSAADPPSPSVLSTLMLGFSPISSDTICPSIHIPMLTSHFQQLQKLSMLSITSHCKENISNPVLEDWWKPWFQSGLQAKIGGGTTQQHEAQNKLTHTLHFVLAMQLELNDNSTAPFSLSWTPLQDRSDVLMLLLGRRVRR